MWASVIGFLTGQWVTNEILGGLVSGVLAAGIVLGWQRFDRWRKYRQPWYTEYEPRRDDISNRIDIKHTARPLEVRLTLRFRSRTHVDRIRFSFEGGSNSPEIKGLFDWNIREGLSDPNVVITSNERGSWYWSYHNQLLRTPGPRNLQNTIAIGLIVQTRGVFDGHLTVQLAFEERHQMPRPERIAVHVTRQSTLDIPDAPIP